MSDNSWSAGGSHLWCAISDNVAMAAHDTGESVDAINEYLQSLPGGMSTSTCAPIVATCSMQSGGCINVSCVAVILVRDADHAY